MVFLFGFRVVLFIRFNAFGFWHPLRFRRTKWKVVGSDAVCGFTLGRRFRCECDCVGDRISDLLLCMSPWISHPLGLEWHLFHYRPDVNAIPCGLRVRCGFEIMHECRSFLKHKKERERSVNDLLSQVLCLCLCLSHALNIRWSTLEFLFAVDLDFTVPFWMQ